MKKTIINSSQNPNSKRPDMLRGDGPELTSRDFSVKMYDGRAYRWNFRQSYEPLYTTSSWGAVLIFEHIGRWVKLKCRMQSFFNKAMTHCSWLLRSFQQSSSYLVVLKHGCGKPPIYWCLSYSILLFTKRGNWTMALLVDFLAINSLNSNSQQNLPAFCTL